MMLSPRVDVWFTVWRETGIRTSLFTVGHSATSCTHRKGTGVDALLTAVFCLRLRTFVFFRISHVETASCDLCSMLFADWVHLGNNYMHCFGYPVSVIKCSKHTPIILDVCRILKNWFRRLMTREKKVIPRNFFLVTKGCNSVELSHSYRSS